ncbi:hypothetical protein ZWY2020_011973 [Hordeum vulgare]|nr:hypothetical protein ZWY2020_011973 [Hordeum vulgare]
MNPVVSFGPALVSWEWRWRRSSPTGVTGVEGMNSYAPGAGYGMSLGLLAGYLWKLHHWSNQRRTREFYSLLDEDRIIVVVDEPAGAKD